VQDRIEGLVVGLHKYGKEHHIVIKTNSGEEMDPRLSEYLKAGYIYISFHNPRLYR